MSSYKTMPTPGNTEWFTHDRFGMFVHWGLYSQLGKGGGYFTQGYGDTMENYSQLVHTFTAEDFDAEKLVLVAKKAGCRYIVLLHKSL